MTERSHSRRGAPERFDVWAPRVTRIIGWGGVVFVTTFWALANRIEPMLLGLFGSFATGGELLAAWRDFRAGLRRALEEDEHGDGG
jgi:hypothetical protein